MAVEYDISSDVAVIKETGSVSQCARVTQMYSGQITYDDEAGSKFATATINGKSQRVMLCIAVNGTVNYDDVPSLYSTVDGHRCLNIVTPTETGTPDDVPSLYETVVIDGQNVRAVRCIMINKTPVYDGVSSTCTFTGDDGKTHTAQLVNQVSSGGIETIVKGMSPLSLPDAIANSLSYVKAFGGTEQNGTPTPDVPVDIVSNNGVLKARHQSGLPLGYTLLEYIETASGSYIDTGITPTINAKADVKFAPTQTSVTWYWGARNDPNRFCCTTFNSGTKFSIGMTNNTWPANRTSVTLESIYDCVVANGYASVNGAEYTETPVESFGNAGTFYLGRITAAKYYKCKLWENNVLVFDGIPAKNANDVIGMYDLVSEQLFTNQGTGDFTAGNPVSDPVEIYTDGTVETINVHGKNLFDQSTATRYKTSWSNSGGGAWQAISSSSEAVTYGSYVKPNTTYTLSKKGGSRLIITGYRTKTEPSSSATPADYQIQTSTTEVVDGSYTFTTPADCTWILFGLRQNNTTYIFPYDIQLEQGSTATEYVPYYDGGTATAEMLLKVGDYQDEQEILSGAVTRNVGIKVLDGTEGWTATTASSGRLVFCVTKASVGSDSTVLPSGSPNIKCSHFETSTAAAQSLYGTVWAGRTAINFTAGDFCANLAAWRQWLAEQYAAGTPVILVYPLATPTTESVAGQTLQVTDGDNVLEITQASLTGLELEAEYSAAVSLTIQEVEDANLDNNVEVTIS